jgi:PAP2 superfamily
MNFSRHSQILFVFGLLLTMFSCGKLKEQTPLARTFNSEVYLEWNNLFIEIERFAPGFRPAPGPRALAYMGISAYEAIIVGMPEHASLQNTFPGGLKIPSVKSDELYHWPAVVNASYAFMMKKFFAQMATGPNANLYLKIEELKNKLDAQYKTEVKLADFERSAAHGEKVASIVFEWSKTDGGHEANLDPQPASYVPPVGPGLWQPTFPGFGRGMFPYYGNKVRPFCMLQTDLIGKPPIPYSEAVGSKFRGQAEYVKAMVDNIKSNGYGGYEDLWVAEFWSDDVLNQTFGPPSRWISITNQVVKTQDASLEKSAEAYAKIGISLSDYVIAAWKTKYYYNIERPVSYIRRVIDPNWISALNDETNGSKPKGITPPFPAYPSGHSGMGSAAAVPLMELFGQGYSMTDLSHEFRIEFNGKPRAYNSFDEMAYENAISRVALGVHFQMDCEEGLRIGYLAGKRVCELPWKK